MMRIFFLMPIISLAYVIPKTYGETSGPGDTLDACTVDMFSGHGCYHTNLVGTVQGSYKNIEGQSVSSVLVRPNCVKVTLKDDDDGDMFSGSQNCVVSNVGRDGSPGISGPCSYRPYPVNSSNRKLGACIDLHSDLVDDVEYISISGNLGRDVTAIYAKGGGMVQMIAVVVGAMAFIVGTMYYLTAKKVMTEEDMLV